MHLKLNVDFQRGQHTCKFLTGLEGSRPAEFESAIRFEIRSTGQTLSPLEMSKKYSPEYITIFQTVAAPTFLNRIRQVCCYPGREGLGVELFRCQSTGLSQAGH